MKCKFCDVELKKKTIYEPFNMQMVVGAECPIIDEYYVCPKCGLRYDKVGENQHG